ncbi:MBL fold metallo-hydrolase [Gimibacter soli]|uniref:MBL fold metallo-hydrolase n=1 Tax=Gimibacter soli TaxID=3024400 RepID=A0AAE9XMK4_9PROT|nr:MBL fold metallo-hydrolase [Gimibacter soli]WCL53727.1 MBL fold metallo-hydrolase [Gimibacter soli]
MLKAQIIPVTAFQQNCSLVWCDETMEGAFVDPGGEPEKLIAAAEARGVKIVKLLLTHGHLDHAGGAAALRERLGVPVIGPQKEDAFWLERIETDAANYGLPGLRSVAPDEWLEDGEQVGFGNVMFDTVYCPGHTPGHVVFFEPNSKVAFVGDVLFKGSVGRTDFPRGDGPTLIKSITEKLWPLGSEVTFVPGHGPLSTFGDERQSNPFVADRVLSRAS